MPWDESDLMTKRLEFVEMALAAQRGHSELTFTEVCQRWKISRKTGYKWLKLFRENGKEGLADRSRRPCTSPLQTPPDIETEVLAVRDAHPRWAGRKIHFHLKKVKKRPRVPASSSIQAILKRNGRINAEKDSPKGGPLRRFERRSPNQLWQMDFKGHFALDDGTRCHPLTALDDHSRFNLILDPCANERAITVRERLIGAFRRYGMPQQILCDNGPCWSARGIGLSGLEAWLIRLDVDVIHGRPYHPQTQGKEERFHRTLDVEVISTRKNWHDLAHCARAFAPWRQVYNFERPHESLGDEVPGNYYQPSTRCYSDQLEAGEVSAHYLDGDLTRKVDRSGNISLHGCHYYVGVGLQGERVGLRACEEGYTVHYAWKLLGMIDPRTGVKTQSRTTPIKKIAR